MPVVDLRAAGSSLPESFFQADVCIVGSGPAGATLAQELSTTRLRVLLLESGDVERSEQADRLNDIENVGRPRVPDQWSVRNRIVGGSSHTWGGRSAPFDEIDYEHRDWVPESGWPFGPEEMDPYLDRSASHLGLAMGTGFSDDRFWSIADRERPGADPDPSVLLPFFWQFSRDPAESYPFEYVRFGRGLADRLGPDVVLVTGANVLRIEPDESGQRVDRVEVADGDGRRHHISARVVVLAAGGIENARLLLNSDTRTPQGLGNDHDLVGRYLMDHLRGPVAEFEVPETRELVKRLGRYNVRGHLFRAGFRLSPEVQRAEGLLNCAAWLGEEVGPDDPWDAMRRLLRGAPELPGDVVSLAQGLPLFARGVGDYFVERNGIPRRFESVTLLAMVEQVPDPDSRVVLSEQRDSFGLPLPRVDWRSHPDEARTMRRTGEIVTEQLARMGLPVPSPSAWVSSEGPVPDSFVDVAHPTGTTRMSVDARSGVVDPDGQVHGVSGLYVTGSSVFPTAGHCNPTQMIVAMAVRLADHLKGQETRKAVVRPAIEVAATPDPDHAGTVGRTVVVTGGTGRIGRVLLDSLLDRGYDVVATTSRTDLPEGRSGLTWRRVDLQELDPEHLDGLVAGADAVLHLAAEIGRQDVMEAVNVVATRELAAAAERAGIEAFVYTSTVSVYGSGRSRTATEDSPTLTVERDVPSEYLAMDYVRAYGRTKLAGERALQAGARAVRYVILRPTVVVDEAALTGIGDWGRGKRLLAAHRHAHHVYVGDVAEAIVWAMERGLRHELDPGAVETYNVSQDEYPTPTHREFLRRAFEATGDARFRVVPVPGLLDWAHDVVRFRRPTLRNPLWRMRFPATKLYAAGYRHRYGMRYAEARALERLQENDRVHDAVDAAAVPGRTDAAS